MDAILDGLPGLDGEASKLRQVLLEARSDYGRAKEEGAGFT